MIDLKPVCFLLFLFISFFPFCQNPNSQVSIELSIPHIREIASLHTYSNKINAYVIIRNNSDSTYNFYEDRYIYGYYNISFEIKYKDSIYAVTRAPKVWWRNHPSYHVVKPKESLVFPHMVIDSSFANVLRHEGVFENGWIGLPAISDTVEIRVIYQLCHPGEVHDEQNIDRLNYRKDDYMDYLDGDIEEITEFEKKSETIKKVEKPKQPVKPKLIPDTARVIIFNEVLVSEWQKVIL